jgi:hypothetical protein
VVVYVVSVLPSWIVLKRLDDLGRSSTKASQALGKLDCDSVCSDDLVSRSEKGRRKIP